MRAGLTPVLGGSNVRKRRRHSGGGLFALLLLQVQASCFLLPTSPASGKPNRLRQHHHLPPLSNLRPGSLFPAPQQQLAAAVKGHRRVPPLSSVQRSTALGGMGASSSRPGALSPQQTSTLIGDERGGGGGGGGYGAAGSDTSLGATVSGEIDPEDPGAGEARSPC